MVTTNRRGQHRHRARLARIRDDGTRQCTHCGKWLEESAFQWCASKPGGFHAQCRACRNSHRRQGGFPPTPIEDEPLRTDPKRPKPQKPACHIAAKFPDAAALDWFYDMYEKHGKGLIPESEANLKAIEWINKNPGMIAFKVAKSEIGKKISYRLVEITTRQYNRKDTRDESDDD